MKSKIIIGSRGSTLAYTQTLAVKAEFETCFPELSFEVLKIKTTGDIQKDAPIGSLNLKGAFTKELDDALLNQKIDLAVHSLKDLPAELPKGISLQSVALCKDPRDALISHGGKKFFDLPKGARIGTASSRRGALIRKLRPDLSVEMLRGNVDTRLQKLERGEFDAIILAAAGLFRLGKENVITEYLDPHIFVPPVGQGMLALVCRAEDIDVARILNALDDAVRHPIALAQRRFMALMEGGCQIPLGCHGEVTGENLRLFGYLATQDGSREIRKEVSGKMAQALDMAERLAKDVLGDGGLEILIQLRSA